MNRIISRQKLSESEARANLVNIIKGSIHFNFLPLLSLLTPSSFSEQARYVDTDDTDSEVVSVDVRYQLPLLDPLTTTR
jgi:hypothetical protein